MKHIHILGICGTFMGGIAMIARQMGYKVTGSDTNIYPPMSSFLINSGIEIIPHYEITQLEPVPDVVIIGNAMKRGNPCVEYVLNHQLNYTSGPQWLHDNLLKHKWVLAIAGTHGKTTTTGMLSWILDQNGIDCGFLVGGIAGNFDVSARLGNSPFFVIEADEYDCAFFDKRSKFIHYNPKTLIINNIDFDHADIFDDLKAIQRQFHHLIRLMPQNGKILSPINDKNVQTTLALGAYSRLEFLGEDKAWWGKPLSADYSHFYVHSTYMESPVEVKWNLIGEHNMHNGLMAIAAAYDIGIPVENACLALSTFVNAKKRLEWKGTVAQIALYDDFAHHPTAIQATLTALRAKVGSQSRILAVLEPRSNTMKKGTFKQKIAQSLAEANCVFIYQPPNIDWNVAEITQQLSQPAFSNDHIELLVQQIVAVAEPQDNIVIMSNGAFGNIHQILLTKLREKEENSPH